MPELNLRGWDPMIAARNLRLSAYTLIVVCGLSSFSRAEPTKQEWDPARTTSPETVEELKALQERVKSIVKKSTPSTVGLLVGNGEGIGAGSGVIVNSDGLILTAAHVIGNEVGITIRVILPDGTQVAGKTLGVNPKIDSGMARITDKPPATATWPGAKEGKWPAAEISKSSGLKEGQWVIALGHPGGPKPDRKPPLRVGRFKDHLEQENAIRTDCTLVGGDSGGPLFDLHGKVVGIHSRIGLFLDSNMHVPTDAFQKEWDKLIKGAVIGKPVTVEIGISFDEDEKEPTVKTVVEEGPAAKAGFEVGDIITKFNGNAVKTTEELTQMLPGFSPGRVVSVEVKREDKTMTLKLTLARKTLKKKK